MAPIISKIELWSDEEGGGRMHVNEFLLKLGDDNAIRMVKTIEGYRGLWMESLFRDEKLVSAGEEYPDLYEFIIEKKRIKVHFFCTIKGGVIWIVHGVKKTKFKPINPSHYKTALQRIKKIN